ncbi:MAG: class I SAM-dependent methyltransferase [Pyrinomonadaceae bacterium]
MQEAKKFDVRENAQKIATEFIEKGDPTGWFDELYERAGDNHEYIPWADLEPNRFLLAWAEKVALRGNGRNALVIGCGLGDDARFLDELGFRVTAFDISPKAIEWARRLNAETEIEFFAADLFDPPADWQNAFDFVLEVYTIQALPPDLRDETIDAIGRFVGDGGHLVVVTRGRSDDEPAEGPPWPLSKNELSRFEAGNLHQTDLLEMEGDEEEPVRRFVVEYEKGM